MKPQTIAFMAVLIILSACSPNLTDPQEAFKYYQNAINSQDYPAIKHATTEHFRAQMKEQGTDLKNVGEYFKSAGLKSAGCKITLFEQVHPERATIGCTGVYEYNDGRVEQSYKEEYFVVIREESKWKVDEYKESVK